MRISAAVLAVVLGAGLVGCSADEEPPGTLPPLPSVSPTAAPVPSPPAEAAAETPKGAEAFARYYLELVNMAFASRDTAALRAASLPGCGGCDDTMRIIEEAKARGETQRGGGFEVQAVTAPGFEGGDVVVLIDASTVAGEVLDRSGSVISTAPAMPKVTAQMRLLRRGTTWAVQGYRIVP